MPTILDNALFTAFSEASEQVYIYVCDVKQDLSHWSKNAVTFFGLPGEYMENAAELWMAKIHPDDRGRYLKDIQDVFTGVKTHHSCEYRARSQAGDYVWLECRGTMMKNEQGEPWLFAGMMTRLDARNKIDPLTGLPTMREFADLNFACTHGVVMVVGFDGFREVINNYGYRGGDEILADFAVQLRRICPQTAALYRFEGDEFAIFIPGGTCCQAQQLFQSLAQAAKALGSRQVSLEITGGAVCTPQDGITQEAVISKLEHSLAHGKAHRRSQLVFFSLEVSREYRRLSGLKQTLVRSVSHDCEGFSLVYQPLVDHDHRVVCCEALLRWKADSDVGEMIRLLENTGEILPVGRWIVREVFAQARVWQQKSPDFITGFNVSYLQFKDSGFSDFLIAEAKRLKINPRQIAIELTESCQVEDFDGLAREFARLRAFGFNLSLDDFGIAYSTLLLIRNLPADSVKIDQSFIRDLTEQNQVDLAIIESVVSLCRKLNIRLEAEGVENARILKLLEAYPITLYQGFHFAKPMPASQLEPLIGSILP